MNPFDLRGPEFLVFYAIFAVIVIVALLLVRRIFESGSPPKVDLADPYLIAHLRGGDSEVLRVALVSLIDRGLLVVSGKQIKRADHAKADAVRSSPEKALLKTYAKPGEATSILFDPVLKLACAEYEQVLKRYRLLPDDSLAQGRMLRFLLASSPTAAQ